MSVSLHTVLCVDDEPHVLLSLSLVLGRHGFTVLKAADATEACTVAATEGIDVALVDHSICAREKVCLRDLLRKAQPGIKVVLHTGNPEIDCCARDVVVLSKPTHPQNLVSAISEICASKREAC